MPEVLTLSPVLSADTQVSGASGHLGRMSPDSVAGDREGLGEEADGSRQGGRITHSPLAILLERDPSSSGR